MDFNVRLGNNIKKFRNAKQITQSSLAEKLFVTPQNISKWENGYSAPDIRHLCLISDFLDVSLEQLIGRNKGEHKGNLMIGIDGGGSKTEFCLFSEDGSILIKKNLGGTNPNIYGEKATCTTLKTGIDLMLNYSSEVVAIFAGISGCGVAKNAENIARFLKKQYPNILIEIKGDIINTIYSTPNYQSCFAVIIGTGSVIYAKNGDDIKRIGGWGYLFDRDYNGYNLGCETIQAVLADEDGISEHTSLTPLLQQKFKGKVTDHINELYEKTNKEIASYSSFLFDAFDKNDSISTEIIKSNISILSDKILNVVKNHPECNKKIIITGGLTARKDILLKYLKEFPNVEYIFPELPSIYGACHYCVMKYGTPYSNFHSTFKSNYEVNKQYD